MHKAGGREAAAIRIVPVGRGGAFLGIHAHTAGRNERGEGKEIEREREREKRGENAEREGIARGGP